MRHQYANLDALRGVAASAVLLHHTQYWFGGQAWFGHGYMAVDFFFVLSGFVIALAYEERLHVAGSLLPFVRDRAIRLYPLILAGAALGMTAYLARARSNGVAIGGGDVAAIVAAAVPWPVTWPIGVDVGDPWPVNPPIWSIFWEIVVNLLFALTVRRWTTRTVVVGVSAGALLLAAFSWHLGGFGHLGPLRDGWILGGPRTLVGFGLGVLALRMHRAGIGTGGGRRWWIAPSLLLATTALPATMLDVRWVDPVVAIVVFPAIVIAAAGCRPFDARIARIGGDLSYPVYAIHMPLLLLFAGAWARMGLNGSAWTPIGGIAILGIIVGVAWSVHRWWDAPVRGRLKARRR